MGDEMNQRAGLTEMMQAFLPTFSHDVYTGDLRENEVRTSSSFIGGYKDEWARIGNEWKQMRWCSTVDFIIWMIC